MRKVLAIFGTRPEAIKLAPVVRACRAHPELEVKVLVTAQHKEMLYQVLDLFDIEPDRDLDIMSERQTLPGLSAKLLERLQAALDEIRPDIVMVQGDTTTTFIGALSAFYARVPVAHVEAGLRSGDKSHPFPEELNRVMTSSLTDIHFAPTESARRNLLAEGVGDGRIQVVGNTVIDSLKYILRAGPPKIEACDPFILVTAHRRENWGRPIENLCHAVRAVAERRPDINFIFSVHKNPAAREPVERLLSSVPAVNLIDAPDYDEFVHLMDRAQFVLSDSGGVQEEAPALGKPVLIFRRTTERPEGIEAGAVKLIGDERAAIESSVVALLEGGAEYKRMSRTRDLYGDGRASERIAEGIAN